MKFTNETHSDTKIDELVNKLNKLNLKLVNVKITNKFQASKRRNTARFFFLSSFVCIFMNDKERFCF